MSILAGLLFAFVALLAFACVGLFVMVLNLGRRTDELVKRLVNSDMDLRLRIDEIYIRIKQFDQRLTDLIKRMRNPE